MDRYEGKPFLKMLECYVLNAIDQLDDARRATLEAMESKLRSTYGVSGSWSDIVGSQMQFPISLPSHIKRVWEAYLAQSRAQGRTVNPDEFAMKFVDENFKDADGDQA